MPSNTTRKLKRIRRRNAFQISGDFTSGSFFSPGKVLLLLYKERKDWMSPVTQKVLTTPARNIIISNSPTSFVENLRSSRILIIKKVMNRRILESWRLEILFTYFPMRMSKAGWFWGVKISKYTDYKGDVRSKE